VTASLAPLDLAPHTQILVLLARESTRGQEALFKSSIPFSLTFVDDSRLALVHADVELDRNLFKGSMYLSLLDIRRYSVCIDLPIPSPEEPLPHMTDRGYGGTYVVRGSIDIENCLGNFVQEH
jgi:hypothetical protein